MKTYEEKLWDWLIKSFPQKTDARRIFDYVTRLNKKPRKIEFYTADFKRFRKNQPTEQQI